MEKVILSIGSLSSMDVDLINVCVISISVGPSQEDIVRGNEVKRNITKELSSAIKTLQKEHLESQEPILSTDSANTVCSVLEAVFLHGVKDSVTKKIASYMSLNQSNENNSGSLNFWQFVSKFTHSDVVTQLKRLGQIYTEIGLCRAWIRVALNDGLMESYVVSMLADKKTLEYFYHKTGYLRDPEQPGILISYLKGLMLLEFKLSYNSSVLNTWTHTPLSLAGIIDAHDTPLPVIHPAKERPVTVVTEDINDSSDEIAVRSVRTRSRVGSTSSGSDVTSGRKKVKEKSNKQAQKAQNKRALTPNSDVYSADLTRDDVEEIRRKYELGSSPQETHMSGCSTSSHTSCPDPVKYNKNPSLLVETKETNDELFDLSDYKILDNGFDDVETAQSSSTGKNNFDIQTDALPDFVQHSMHLDNTAAGRDDLGTRYPGGNKMPDITQNITQNIRNGNTAVTIQKSYVLSESDSDSFSLEKNASLSDHSVSQTPPANNDPCSSNEHNSEVTSKSKTTKSKGKKHKLKPNLSPPNKTSVMPEVSNAIADTVERSHLNLSKPRLSLPDIRLFQGSSSSPNLMDSISEREGVKPRSESLGDVVDGEDADDGHFVGNSLGARSGWSSSFDLEVTDVLEPLQPRSQDIGEDGIPIRRSKAESFGSMLKNYTPSSSVASPSLDDVLQNLPHSSTSSPMKSQFISAQDYTEDYEIITNTMTSVINKDDETHSQMGYLTIVANEMGLDACNFQCFGCKRPIGIIYGKPRVCTYDGGYYCFECHENDEYYIPAFIIHNWDFRKHKVSKRSIAFLQDIEDQALIDISDVNNKLYEHVKEMEDIQKLREQLFYLKAYMFTCKQSIAEDFRKSLWPKEYMYESIHRYSFGDLLQVPSGQLLQSLKKTIKFATKHVYDCGLCSQKGFICEICHNHKVIYPFEIELTCRCLQCKSVFHKACKTESQHCPKCQRRQNRKKVQTEPEAETPDSADYAYSPK